MGKPQSAQLGKFYNNNNIHSHNLHFSSDGMHLSKYNCHPHSCKIQWVNLLRQSLHHVEAGHYMKEEEEEEEHNSAQLGKATTMTATSTHVIAHSEHQLEGTGHAVVLNGQEDGVQHNTGGDEQVEERVRHDPMQEVLDAQPGDEAAAAAPAAATVPVSQLPAFVVLLVFRAASCQAQSNSMSFTER